MDRPAPFPVVARAPTPIIAPASAQSPMIVMQASSASETVVVTLSQQSISPPCSTNMSFLSVSVNAQNINYDRLTHSLFFVSRSTPTATQFLTSILARGKYRADMSSRNMKNSISNSCLDSSLMFRVDVVQSTSGLSLSIVIWIIDTSYNYFEITWIKYPSANIHQPRHSLYLYLNLHWRWKLLEPFRGYSRKRKVAILTILLPFSVEKCLSVF